MTGSCATRCPWPIGLVVLKRRAKAAGIPVIYADANVGRWKSDFRRILERCLQAGTRGRPLAERLAPDEDDYFVLKPKHSAFFATTLHTLLRYLRVQTVILTGLTGNGLVPVASRTSKVRASGRARQAASRAGSRRARAVSAAATSTACR